MICGGMLCGDVFLVGELFPSTPPRGRVGATLSPQDWREGLQLDQEENLIHPEGHGVQRTW